MANLLAQIFRPLFKAAEGQYRPGPYLVNYGGTEGGGWLPAGSPVNYWQHGTSLQPVGERSAMVEACVSAYAQTVAMCPGTHWRKLDDGGREPVTNSDLSRILRKPNDYQTISDFLMNLTRRLYAVGEAFALVIRNNRGEVSEIHQMRNGSARLAIDGSIFYDLSGNEIVETRFDLSLPIPARDVLHARLHTPKHPLKGVSPILATTLDLAMSGAVLDQQIAFYLNQARPSFMLETDRDLNKDQVKELRQRWLEQTTGENAGGSPILTHGLKANPVTVTAQDGQVAEMRKLSDQSIAMAFRIPLQMLGIGGTPFASTEALMRNWDSQGLGFCLNHIELAFDSLFRLRGQPDEYTEFDTAALLRSEEKERIDSLVRAIQGGLISPNEARAILDYGKVEGGEDNRIQAQVVPFIAWNQPSPNMPSAPSAPTSANDDTGDGQQKNYDDEDVQSARMARLVRMINDASDQQSVHG